MGLLPRDLKDANRIVNSTDPDQTAPLGLIAQKLMMITFMLNSNLQLVHSHPCDKNVC